MKLLISLLILLSFCQISWAQNKARVSAFADPKSVIRIKMFDDLALPVFSGNDFKNTVTQSILLTPTPFWVRWQFHQRFAFESHIAGTILLGGANLHLTHHWYEKNDLAIAFKYGFSIPSWALNMGVPLGLNGFFAPSCKVYQAEPERNQSCENYGWAITPQVAVISSLKLNHAILSAQLDLGVGILLTGERRRALNQFAPAELLFSPLTNRYRTHIGLQYDQQLFDRLRIIGGVDVYRVGDDKITSPWYFSAHISIDYWFTDRFYSTLGLMYWNYDQHQTQWTKTEKIGNTQYYQQEKIRSQDLYPCIDFGWYF